MSAARMEDERPRRRHWTEHCDHPRRIQECLRTPCTHTVDTASCDIWIHVSVVRVRAYVQYRTPASARGALEEMRCRGFAKRTSACGFTCTLQAKGNQRTPEVWIGLPSSSTVTARVRCANHLRAGSFLVSLRSESDVRLVVIPASDLFRKNTLNFPRRNIHTSCLYTGRKSAFRIGP